MIKKIPANLILLSSLSVFPLISLGELYTCPDPSVVGNAIQNALKAGQEEVELSTPFGTLTTLITSLRPDQVDPTKMKFENAAILYRQNHVAPEPIEVSCAYYDAYGQMVPLYVYYPGSITYYKGVAGDWSTASGSYRYCMNGYNACEFTEVGNN